MNSAPFLVETLNCSNTFMKASGCPRSPSVLTCGLEQYFYLTRGPKILNGERIVFSTDSAGATGDPHVKK